MFADRAASQEHLDVGGLIGRPGGFARRRGLCPMPPARRREKGEWIWVVTFPFLPLLLRLRPST